MATKRERERKERGSAELVLVSIYGLFIYVPLSGFLPLTPAKDSHRMIEMYRAGGSALVHLLSGAASHVGQAGGFLFLSFILSQ